MLWKQVASLLLAGSLPKSFNGTEIRLFVEGKTMPALGKITHSLTVCLSLQTYKLTSIAFGFGKHGGAGPASVAAPASATLQFLSPISAVKAARRARR